MAGNLTTRSTKPAKHQTTTAVDRFFAASLLLTLGIRFATLASTGKLDVISVTLVFAAFAARLWGYASDWNLMTSNQVVTREMLSVLGPIIMRVM